MYSSFTFIKILSIFAITLISLIIIICIYIICPIFIIYFDVNNLRIEWITNAAIICIFFMMLLWNKLTYLFNMAIISIVITIAIITEWIISWSIVIVLFTMLLLILLIF